MSANQKPAFSSDAQTLATLQHLIQTCQQGENVFRHAAQLVQDEHLKRLFLANAHQHNRFAAELKAQLDRPAVAARRATEADRHLLSDNLGETPTEAWPAESAFEQCLLREEQALNNYSQALQTELPWGAHFLIEAQFALLRQNHNRIRSLKESNRTEARPELWAAAAKEER